MFHQSIAFLLLFFLSGFLNAEPQDNAPAKTIRIMTVVIVQQDDFLQYLLESWLSDKNTHIEYSKGHHSEVARAVMDGKVDFAITHTKVQAMHKLEKQGLLEQDRILFANAMAFLGPQGDPAGITGLNDPVKVVQKILDGGYCFVINGHDRLARIQEKLLAEAKRDHTCVIRDDNIENETAIESAVANKAYTLWGLHPYARLHDNRLQPVVVPNDMLLEEMSGWAAKDSPVKKEVMDLINYLKSSEAEKKLRDFRLEKFKDLQAWWPAS